MWYKNIAGRFFGLVAKHECDRRTDGQTHGRTDRRTDGQNYDSQDRASIAVSRGKNSENKKTSKQDETHNINDNCPANTQI